MIWSEMSYNRYFDDEEEEHSDVIKEIVKDMKKKQKQKARTKDESKQTNLPVLD